MKILIRILACPFLFGFVIIHHNIIAFHRIYLFLKYGGEWIQYDRNINNKTIQDHYEKTYN